MDYQQQYDQWARAKAHHVEQKRRAKTAKVLGMLCLLALCAFFLKSLRTPSANTLGAIKKNIRVAKGTVMTAESVVQPDGKSVNTGEVIESYEQSPGNSVTRSFYLDNDMPAKDLPRTGDSVVVTWSVDKPDSAYLMPLDKSPYNTK